LKAHSEVSPVSLPIQAEKEGWSKYLRGQGLLQKRTANRDESTWVVTHVHTKAMLGIFLYSYP
jgi:hypothetical protein